MCKNQILGIILLAERIIYMDLERRLGKTAYGSFAGWLWSKIKKQPPTGQGVTK